MFLQAAVSCPIFRVSTLDDGRCAGTNQLEALPDYYVNRGSAKRLWQDWRVLRRLFLRRDPSRDLLLQGKSGWVAIHGMTVNRRRLMIATDEGRVEVDLGESLVWLSRANPANTQADGQTSRFQPWLDWFGHSPLLGLA